MRYRTWICALFAAAALALASNEASAVEANEPGPLPPVLEGKATGAWAKADGALRRVVAEFGVHQERGMPGPFRPSNTTLQYARGRIVIDAVAAGDPEALLEDLERLGLQNGSRYGAVVSGALPIGVIGQAVELDSLRAVAASRKPLTNVGDVTSEGVAAMYADTAQSSYLGTGVTVGVLSDSYDQQGGASGDVASGDLPPGVTVLDDTADCGGPCTDEGRGMMQLIYDVAPGTNLAFHTAFGGMADFANGIGELAAAGSDIIVDDVIYFAEPMYQDGIIAQAVDNVVGQGVPYFSSAGNFARKSYESAYVGSGEILTVNGEFRGELHDFDPGASTDWAQSFTIPDLPSGTYVTLVLQWDEPFGSVSTGNRSSSSDVDIYIVDSSDVVVASSIDDNIASGEPIEILQFRIPPCSMLEIILGIGCVNDQATYKLYISLYAGPAPGALKYVLFQRDIDLEYPTHSSALYGHANAAGAEAVGAAFYQATPRFCDNTDGVTYNDCDVANGVDTATLEWFSAAGGTATLFNNDGQRLDPPELRKRPGVVGPDGTNTTFFYADSTRDADTWPNFFGTSASAPHVAGVGALMLQANPGLIPGDVYAALESTALNMNPRAEGSPEDPDGFDFDTGYGFVQADLAVNAVAGGPGNTPPVAVGDGATVAEGGTVTLLDGGAASVLANDTDTENDPLSAILVSGPSHASSFALNSNGTFSYTHDGTETTSDSFTYKANDGTADSNVATVTVTVNPVNDAPVAVDDSYSTNENTPLNVAAPGVLTNDTDPEGDTLTAVQVTGPSNGTLTLNANGSFSYTPNGGFTGADGFTYRANDGTADSNVATVTITVNAVGGGSPPVASFTYQCKKLDCTFDGTGSTDPDGDIASYGWDFGDGSVGSGSITSHSYGGFTTYIARLTVTDAAGNAATAEATFTLLNQNKPVKGSASSAGGGGGGGSDFCTAHPEHRRCQ